MKISLLFDFIVCMSLWMIVTLNHFIIDELDLIIGRDLLLDMNIFILFFNYCSLLINFCDILWVSLVTYQIVTYSYWDFLICNTMFLIFRPSFLLFFMKNYRVSLRDFMRLFLLFLSLFYNHFSIILVSTLVTALFYTHSLLASLEIKCLILLEWFLYFWWFFCNLLYISWAFYFLALIWNQTMFVFFILKMTYFVTIL